MICVLSFRYKQPVYGSSITLLFLHYRNPYLILRIFRIGADVYLNVGSAAVFISGCGQPLCHDAPFQILNRQIGSRTRKNCPCGRRNPVLFERGLRRPGTGNSDKISPVLLIIADAYSQQAGRPSIIDASFCIVPSAAAFPHICGTTAKFSSRFLLIGCAMPIIRNASFSSIL